MAIIEPKISYAKRSYEEIRQQLIGAVQATEGLNERWTDFNESDVGMVLLELWCSIGEELNFFLDNQANEAFLTTARQRKSVVNLCKLIAYKLDPAVSAEGKVIFTWVPQDGDDYPPRAIEIPKYTRLSTAGTEPVPFVTIDSVVLPAGTLAVESRIRQGVLFEEEFKGTGAPYQELVLDRNDIAANYGAVEVLIGQGDDLTQYIEWEEANNFIINSPDDNQYRFIIETDHNDKTRIKFGDGRFGAIPQDGFTIVVRYLASNGKDGNVGANTVATVEDQLYDVNGLQASLVASNPEPCVGGSDRESIEKAQRQAPQELSALYRMVTRFDGDALVSGLAGVAKAKVWGEQEMPHPDIKHFNQMYVTFVADGIEPEAGRPESWLPPNALKELILEYAEDKKIITTNIVFVDPQVVFVDLEIDAYISKTASLVSTQQAITSKIEEFFDMANHEFGEDLRYSHLLAFLDEVPNIDYIRLKLKRNGAAPAGNPTCKPDYLGTDPLSDPEQWEFEEQDIIVRRNEFIQLGSIVAGDGSETIVHFQRDDEPIRAQILFSPLTAKIGVPVTFDGRGSTSPYAEINTYQWNMGARGRLMTKNADGTYSEATVQPSDNQTIVTDFDGSGNLFGSFIWKYTERPGSGIASVSLLVLDTKDRCASTAAPYRIEK